MMQTDRRPLSDRLAVFPRLGLANLPTPLEPMKRLTAHLGGPRLWVKREDATGLGFGGNKLRKLDYVLHEAVASGADTIVSGGVVQSNSQRQVAAVAAKLGLACHLAVYHGRLEPPTPEYKTSGNAFLNRLFGAHLHDVPWTGDRNTAIRTLVGDLETQGHRPYFVPYGVRMPWARSLMPRRFPRSNRKQRSWASHQPLSCTAPEAPARRLVSCSVQPSQCQTRGSLGLISTPSPRGCEPMS
jgi:L-cysteate sulfo-lyase